MARHHKNCLFYLGTRKVENRRLNTRAVLKVVAWGLSAVCWRSQTDNHPAGRKKERKKKKKRWETKRQKGVTAYYEPNYQCQSAGKSKSHAWAGTARLRWKRRRKKKARIWGDGGGKFPHPCRVGLTSLWEANELGPAARETNYERPGKNNLHRGWWRNPGRERQGGKKTGRGQQRWRGNPPPATLLIPTSLPVIVSMLGNYLGNQATDRRTVHSCFKKRFPGLFQSRRHTPKIFHQI